MDIQTIISIISVSVAITAIFVSIILNKQTLKYSRKLAKSQSVVNIFVTYTQRFMELEKERPNFEICGNDKVDSYMTQYFNLCSEEYYLFKKNYIEKDVWKFWKEGMHQEMNEKFHQSEWEKLNAKYNEDFRKFFNMEIIDMLKH
jgi:hypothetical protein